MRLRGVLLDPGRRGARAMALAAVVAAVVAALWALLDTPAGGAKPLDNVRTPGPGFSSAAGDPAGGSAAPTGSAQSDGPAGSGSDAGQRSGASSQVTELVVDVAGQVIAPGVYRLPPGSRVIDAVTAAGGPAPGADLSPLNLARLLVDGEQIAVGVPGAPAAQSTDAAGAKPGGVVDLNTASVAQLDELPGIGPVLAQNIVSWRTEHGPFAAVDQLAEVPGIGPSKLAQLAERVTV